MRLRDSWTNELIYDPFGSLPDVKFAPPGTGPDGKSFVTGPGVALYGYWQDMGAEIPG